METMQHYQVPAWLNLDAIAPPDLRAEIAALTPECVAMATAVTELVVRVVQLKSRLESAEDGAQIGQVDDLCQYVDELTGWDQIAAVFSVINGAAASARDGCVTESHYRSCATRLGLAAIVWPDYLTDRIDAQPFTIHEPTDATA